MSLKIRCLDTDLSALDHLSKVLSVSTEMNDIELSWPNMYKDCVLAGTSPSRLPDSPPFYDSEEDVWEMGMSKHVTFRQVLIFSLSLPVSFCPLS